MTGPALGDTIGGFFKPKMPDVKDVVGVSQAKALVTNPFKDGVRGMVQRAQIVAEPPLGQTEGSQQLKKQLGE